MNRRSLVDRFRCEIRGLLDTPQWSERSLADAMDATQGKLQGWMRGQRPTTPKIDSLEALALAQGLTVPELVKKIYGLDASPPGKSWAELGKEAIANPAKLREFLSELNAEQIATLMAAAVSAQGKRLRDHR